MDENGNNLKRSVSPVHQADNNGQQGRQRSRAACVPCRQRKRKCDGRMPCGTCVRYEYQCVHAASRQAAYLRRGDVPQDPPQPATLGYTNSERIQRQPHPLTAPGARFHHRGILDPTKTRFVRANSAIAFPRILGMDLESESVPRLHSFAWHLGVRPEPHDQLVELTSLLTWTDMQDLAKVYFAIVKPEIGHLEEADFMGPASARFADAQHQDDFDAVILGVAALGSFFSASPHPGEEDFVLHARKSLSERSMLRGPSPTNISAWILRTLYLRLTARPHAAWMASCISLHHAEAIGLHKELQTIAVVYPTAPTGDHKLAKTRRRLFWIAKALNIILSFEYGRSKVLFEVVTCKRFASESGTYAHQFVELADLLPSDYVDPDREPDPPAALSSALTKIEEMQSDSSFINLLRADLAFGIYRRLWLMSLTDAKDRADTVINIGRTALDACAKMLQSRTPWWNVLGAPFQFLCVLLAIATPKSFAIVPKAMDQLQRIVQTYNTHMVREAYNQALALVNMAKRRKEREVDALNAVAHMLPVEDPPNTLRSTSSLEPPEVDWTAADIPFDWDWDMFLNPSLIMTAHQDSYDVNGSFGAQLGMPAPDQSL